MNRTGKRVMLLVDADNVSADVIEQAVQRSLDEHGSVHVRRAYCNAETALKQQALFKRLSLRPMVNLSAGKNSTDIALAVDAIDLAIVERPDLVILVSSDSDFAPLVIRLREKGCRVCGIGQQGKTGEETVGVYDSFVDLQHHGAPRAVADSRLARPAARRSTRAAAVPEVSPRASLPAAPIVAVALAPAPIAATAPAAKRPARSPRRAKPEPAPSLPAEALLILEAVSELGMGNKVELNVATEGLRNANLLGRSASSPKLFKKYPNLFLLTPEKTPQKVQYIGPMPS